MSPSDRLVNLTQAKTETTDTSYLCSKTWMLNMLMYDTTQNIILSAYNHWSLPVGSFMLNTNPNHQRRLQESSAFISYE
jgi:hypothetical protein